MVDRDSTDNLMANSLHRPELKSEYASLNPSTRSWEIPEKNVIVKKVVGKGAFGQVATATATGLHGSPNTIEVAVKMLKGINELRYVVCWHNSSFNCWCYFDVITVFISIVKAVSTLTVFREYYYSLHDERKFSTIALEFINNS